MSLTPEERRLIARRASGEYAVDDAVLRIARAHRKDDGGEDKIFVDFIRLLQSKSYDQSDYDRLAEAILLVEDDPWDIREVVVRRNYNRRRRALQEESAESLAVESNDTPTQTPATEATTDPIPVGNRRSITCRVCGISGHNARTCPSKMSTPIIVYADGCARLSPGFDPNPPIAEESLR